MSAANCRRWFVVAMLGSIGCCAGCSATRWGEAPRMNWAWWRKNATDPQLRHDELSPPSATLDPSASLAATESAQPTQPQTNPVPSKPNELNGPPSPRTFGNEPPLAQVAAQIDAKASANSAERGSTPPMSHPGAGSAPNFSFSKSNPVPNPTGKIPDSFDNDYAQQSSGTMGVPAASALPVQQQSIPAVMPQRYSNPYVPQNAATNSTATGGTSPAAQFTGEQPASSVTKTPFNPFAPKSTQPTPPANAPLRPMPSTQSSSVDISSEPVPQSSPPAMPSLGSPTASPTKADAKTAPANSETMSPLELIQSPSSGYAPGSIRQGTSSGSSTAPSGTFSTSAPALPAAQTQTQSKLPGNPAPAIPSTGSSIGGGGSFKIGQ